MGHQEVALCPWGLRAEESSWCLNLCLVQHNSVFRFLLLPRRPDTVSYLPVMLLQAALMNLILYELKKRGNPWVWLARRDSLEQACSLEVCTYICSLLWCFFLTTGIVCHFLAYLPPGPFPRVTQQRMSHPNSSQEQQCLGEWKCQRGTEDFCSANLNIKFLSKYSISTVGKHVGERERRNSKTVHR